MWQLVYLLNFEVAILMLTSIIAAHTAIDTASITRSASQHVTPAGNRSTGGLNALQFHL